MEAIEAVAKNVAAPVADMVAHEPGLEASLQRPSAQMSADFAQAVNAADGRVASLETGRVAPETIEMAATPPAGDTFGHRLTRQADALVEHLRALAPRTTAEAAPSDTTAETNDVRQQTEVAASDGRSGAVKPTVGDSIAEMERAYMFAIEATLASRGSTEASKIFNTLLKGQ